MVYTSGRDGHSSEESAQKSSFESFWLVYESLTHLQNSLKTPQCLDWSLPFPSLLRIAACECTLYMFWYGYSLCAWSVNEYHPPCWSVSVSMLHLHFSLWNRCSVTNAHCAPLFSCLSSRFFLTFSVSPFIILCLLVTNTLCSISPLLGSFSFCVSKWLFVSILCLRFFPLLSPALSLLLKMMLLIKRMVRSSHSASKSHNLMFFFFSSFPSPLFSSPSLRVICYFAVCATVPPAVSLITHSFLWPSYWEHHYTTYQINYTSEFMFCFTIMLFLMWKRSNHLQLYHAPTEVFNRILQMHRRHTRWNMVFTTCSFFVCL